MTPFYIESLTIAISYSSYFRRQQQNMTQLSKSSVKIGYIQHNKKKVKQIEFIVKFLKVKMIFFC